jgi:hypothetical protein
LEVIFKKWNSIFEKNMIINLEIYKNINQEDKEYKKKSA